MRGKGAVLCVGRVVLMMVVFVSLPRTFFAQQKMKQKSPAIQQGTLVPAPAKYAFQKTSANSLSFRSKTDTSHGVVTRVSKQLVQIVVYPPKGPARAWFVLFRVGGKPQMQETKIQLCLCGRHYCDCLNSQGNMTPEQAANLGACVPCPVGTYYNPDDPNPHNCNEEASCPPSSGEGNNCAEWQAAGVSFGSVPVGGEIVSGLASLCTAMGWLGF